MRFETFDLTETQLSVLESTDKLGNRCAVFRLQGDYDPERLARAVREVVARCPPFLPTVLNPSRGKRGFCSRTNRLLRSACWKPKARPRRSC